MGLPMHHAIRNVTRRPLRSALLVLGCALVSALLVGTSAFVRSLEASHLGNSPKNTAIIISTSAERDILRSSMSPAVAELLAADVPGVVRIGGVPASSPEIHMGTDLSFPGDSAAYTAVVRGVTERAYLVHHAVTLTEGELPGAGEALVGRIAAEKMGLDPDRLPIGATIQIEGGDFRISGKFSARGTTVESEIWLPLAELQGLAQRDDVSAVFVRVQSKPDLGDVELFAVRRLDLEIESVAAEVYYAELAAYFKPILGLAWAMAILIAIAATTGGANTVIASVQDRVRELATLRAIGYRGFSLALSILTEVLLLGMAGALLGLFAARALVSQVSVSMAMTAFQLNVDPTSALMGLVGILIVVVASTAPALLRILRLPVAHALRES